MRNRSFGVRAFALLATAVAATTCGKTTEVTLTCKAGVDCNYSDANITVHIPAAAIPNGLNLVATKVSNPPDATTIVPGTSWQVDPSDAVFSPRASLSVTLSADSLARAAGVRRSELGLYLRSGSAWARVDSQSVDTTALTVSAKIGALGLFAVMGAPAASVAVTPAPDTVIAPHTTQLGAVVKDANGTILGSRGVTWSSSATGVATVDANGLVTGVSGGTATITATSDTAHGAATVVVLPAAATIAVTPSPDTLAPPLTAQLSAAVKDAGGSTLPNRPVTWNSSATSVATVDAAGIVTAVAVGTATITATSDTAHGSASVVVIAPVACGASGTGALVTGLSRDGGSTAGGTTVRLAGTGFKATDCVYFGSQQATTTFINSTAIDAVVPAAADTGVVDVKVNQNGILSTLTGGWTYYAAPTTTYATADFEDGTPGGWTENSGATVSTDVAYAGTHSGRSQAINGIAGTGANGSFRRSSGTYGSFSSITSASNKVYLYTAGGAAIGPFAVTSSDDSTLFFTGDATGAVVAYGPPYQTAAPFFSTTMANNPPLNQPNGLYERWYLYIPSATLANLANTHLQIKLQLLRITTGSGQPGWLVPGIGEDFAYGGHDDWLDIIADPGAFLVTGGRPTQGFSFGDGVWHEIQFWQRRVGGVGYVRVWIDGKLTVDFSDARLGSDVSTDSYKAQIGIAYTQNGGPVTVYIDNATLANGYIDP